MIKDILRQNIHFEGAANLDKFHSIFTSLYNIELFKNGLDLCLTRMAEGNLKFEVKIIKGWDTNVGCYLKDQEKVFNKVLNTFSTKFKHKIIIRNLLVNVVAHEMAHALEVESEIVLNENFRTGIGFDMKDRSPNNPVLKGEIKRIMVEGVKTYPQHQIISELFARYFELLSLSRDVEHNGGFTTEEVTEFFANSTKWLNQVFNPKIKDKIDLAIARHTSGLIARDTFKTEKKFAHKVDSFYKKVDEKGQKTWSANVKSNAAWQKSWQQYDQKQIQNPNSTDKNNEIKD